MMEAGPEITFGNNRCNSFSSKGELETDGLSDFNGFGSERSKLDMGTIVGSIKTKKKELPRTDVEASLRQEILQLEKRLHDQVGVRCGLEKALGYKSSSPCHIINEESMPKPATELIKEIAVLEVEVTHLEQYLLSLYRKAFDQQVSTPPPKKEEKSKPPLTTPRRVCLEFSDNQNLVDSSVQRCHSSLSSRASPKSIRACFSQPLSMTEYAQNSSTNVISLAEHLGTRISDHVPDTPNNLSEDMIKCMAAIYCKLADPPSTNRGHSSPSSSLSSTSAYSPKDQYDTWSPGFRKYSSFDVRLDNPFHVEGLKEFSGPYSTMVEVSTIYRNNKNLEDIDDMLQNFRSLISRLEEVDIEKLRHGEKVAFWINVHNSLVMHALLAYGIPQNNVKRVFILLKAAYNVGGHIISADTIQNIILGCRMSRPGQWLRLLLPSSRTKLSGDQRQAFSINQQEPLLHFALCSGSHSDPAVRVYTPKRIFQELEIAKEEYIRATFGVKKDHKVLLPKVVENFAKDSGLCPVEVLEIVQQCLPESLRKSVKKCQLVKHRKGAIEWAPYNFAFRYLVSKELVR
ncbi:uncharacterized protein LOC124925478 [Impatiens glandulifera]|uniref:uncharacterized protein LOC124925478 n=1 Tax=Impatiens glandulifera TaxID=253017 RepID=UPI001FB06898|nr:uncharacterized protein LOC124925478 [Impatiens glandulifera]